MDELSFPLIIISGPSATPIDTRETFIKLLRMSTDRSIETGFYREARLFGTDGKEFSVRKVRLSPERWFSWMKPHRKIERFEVEEVRSSVELEEIKQLVLEVICDEDNHYADPDLLNGIAECVRSAESFHELIEAMLLHQ